MSKFDDYYVSKIQELEATVAELQAKYDAMREAARRTVDALRGSGGIDPEGAAALRVLESLLNRVTDM